MKKTIATLLALVLVLGMLPMQVLAAPYSDIDGHWAEDAIERWSDYGVIQGNKGRFQPYGTLTRAHLATILARLLALPEAESAGFADTAGHWAEDAIDRCAAAGILLGDDGKAFPDAPVSRQQAMTMIARALGYRQDAVSALEDFLDADKISGYAAGYLAALVNDGVVLGHDGYLEPYSNINRGQMVAIVDRMIDHYANRDGQTLSVESGGYILVVAKNVTLTDVPADAVVVATKDAAGLTVNGVVVAPDQEYTVPEKSPASDRKPPHQHSYDETTLKCACGDFHSDVVATVNSERGYTELAAAFAAAESGATVKLLKNATLSEPILVDQVVVLNLNGKSITPIADYPKTMLVNGQSCNCDNLFSVKYGGDLTINGEGSIDTGDNKDIYSPIKLTTKGETYNGKSAKLTVNGATLKGYYYAIVGNGNRHHTEITITDGTFGTYCADDSTAIYHPQDGILNISGGTFEAYSAAVELRAGTLNISGGTFTATATTFKCKKNGSGTTTVGAAIAIAQHTEKKDISVNISGGSFTGVRAFNEDDPQNNKSTNVTLSITGGTFNGLVRADSKANKNARFITGGTITTSQNKDALQKHIPLDYAYTYLNLSSGKDELYRYTDFVHCTAETEGVVATTGGKYYADLKNALKAVANNGTITLTADIDTPSTGYSASAKTITIDLNGHTITGRCTNGVLQVSKNANWTIQDSQGGGGIIAVEVADSGGAGKPYAMAVAANGGGTITITGGSFTQRITSAVDEDSQFDLIYAEKGTITITGGTFTGATPGWTLNCHGNNYAAGTAKIIVEGGSFTGFDPANGNDGSYLAEGCGVKKTGNVYVVSQHTAAHAAAEETTTDWTTMKNVITCATCGYQRIDAAPSTYYIGSKADLVAFAEKVNNKTLGTVGKTFVLTADITFTESETWTPIGQSATNSCFYGTFDGQGHTIYNMKVSVSDNAEGVGAGFFGFIDNGDNGAVIKDLHFDGASVSAYRRAGVVVGYMHGKIQNCTVKNSAVTVQTYPVSATSYDDGDKVGGIAGFLNVGSAGECQITGCSVTDTTIKAYRDIGGIVGYACANTTVSGNTISGVTITIDKSHDYNNYGDTQASYDANDIVGEADSTATVSGNTGTANIGFAE